jgi:hypothetical protein
VVGRGCADETNRRPSRAASGLAADRDDDGGTVRSESRTFVPRAGVRGGQAVKRTNRRLIAVSLPIATIAASAIAGVALLLSAEEARTPRPASTTQPDPFAKLRARPLRLPARRRGNCSLSPQLSRATELPGIPAEAGLGAGPVYVAFPAIPRVLDLFPPERNSPLEKSRWRSAETVWVSEPAYDGPVLVRGRQLDGANRIGFGTRVSPERELRLPAGSWVEGRPLRAWGRRLHTRKGWRVALAYVRIRAEGCYAFQVDGESFSVRIGFYTALQR